MTSYTNEFYKSQIDRSRSSAEQIVPELIRLLSPKSVLDVGCGTGTWLSVFDKHGVSDALGLDGAWVTRDVLVIPPERFRVTDLSSPVELNRRFDLAISMEVGEHLPTPKSETFVASIAKHAPAVLFSAAVPKQGGTDHINEQWQSWWAAKFASHGYVAIDLMRAKFWDDPKVQWWYAQNMLLFVDKNLLSSYPMLKEWSGNTGPLDVVHPSSFLTISDLKNWSSVSLAKELPSSVFRAVKRRLGGPGR